MQSYGTNNREAMEVFEGSVVSGHFLKAMDTERKLWRGGDPPPQTPFLAATPAK
jgi:hypothetical protein